MKAEYDFSKGKRGALLSTKGKTRITIYLETTSLTPFALVPKRKVLAIKR